MAGWEEGERFREKVGRERKREEREGATGNSGRWPWLKGEEPTAGQNRGENPAAGEREGGRSIPPRRTCGKGRSWLAGDGKRKEKGGLGFRVLVLCESRSIVFQCKRKISWGRKKIKRIRIYDLEFYNIVLKSRLIIFTCKKGKSWGKLVALYFISEEMISRA